MAYVFPLLTKHHELHVRDSNVRHTSRCCKIDVTALLYLVFACVVATEGICAQEGLKWPPINPGSPLSVWTVPSLERVSKTTQAHRNNKSISLWTARGEYEAFQIVIRGKGVQLTGIDLVATDLRSGAQAISARNIDLYREHFVYVVRSSPDLRGSNRPLGPGWYPDALVPLHDTSRWGIHSQSDIPGAPFDLAADTNQPIWIDVFTPTETAPGIYNGALLIFSDQGFASIDFTLNVWRFALPKTPSLKSALTIDKPLAESRAAQEELIHNRLMPRATGPSDEKYFSSMYGMSTTGLWFWSNAETHSCSMLPPPPVPAIKKEMKRHHPGLPTYVYSADEITYCRNLFPILKRWAQNIHAAGARNLVTAAPIAELQDDGSGTGRSVADIWVLLPKMFYAFAHELETVRAKGDEVWSYTALVSDPYSPKWLVDFAPTNYRIHSGFLSEALGLAGIVYWSVNAWTQDPWHSIDYEEESNVYPGEGILIYPGEAIGRPKLVVPSIRLKWLRDGVEDYEYVELLKRMGRGAWALEVIKQAAVDWHIWTKDPGDIESVRQRLGQELSNAVNH